MPHLQFDINKKVSPSKKKKFHDYIKLQFSRIMKTGTDHIAISLREFKPDSLTLGRSNYKEGICLMNLDLREGRTLLQKRNLVKSFMDGVYLIFGIKKKNQYITFTSHSGQDFNLIEKSLKNWVKHDKPLNK
tara:strand:- start:92 stop:487 length:396 start_codon:yes stop_codon:yes gene_type:complete